jgi:amino acid permease
VEAGGRRRFKNLFSLSPTLQKCKVFETLEAISKAPTFLLISLKPLIYLSFTFFHQALINRQKPEKYVRFKSPNVNYGDFPVACCLLPVPF